MNALDRFHLVADVIDRVPQLGPNAAYAKQAIRDKLIKQLIGICFLACPFVLDATRVKENCFSLSFIPSHSCQTGRRASTGKFCRVSRGVRPPRGRVGGRWRLWRAVRSRGASLTLTHPRKARRQAKPPQPACQRAPLSRSSRFRNRASGPHPHTVRRCRPCGTRRGQAGGRVVPGAEVPHLLCNLRVINHRDDAHRALTDGAAQRVNMPDHFASRLCETTLLPLLHSSPRRDYPQRKPRLIRTVTEHRPFPLWRGCRPAACCLPRFAGLVIEEQH